MVDLLTVTWLALTCSMLGLLLLVAATRAVARSAQRAWPGRRLIATSPVKARSVEQRSEV